MDEIKEEKNKVVYIQSVTKGKRILTFLADFFLLFIVTFVIFNALVMPISNAALNTTGRDQKSQEAAMNQYNILYNQQVMLHEGDDDLFSYNDNVEFTMNCFLSYYSFEDTDTLEAHPQYGHKAENEVIKHFFVDIRNNKQAYLDLFSKFNEEYSYFNVNEDNYALKDDIKANIKLSFFSPNDMSKDGETMLANLQNGFMNLYAEVFTDIKKNDLVYNNGSYLAYEKIVKEAEDFFNWHLVIASISSYLFSVIIYFLIIPIIHQDNRTLAMMMMRVTRIGTNNLYTLSNVENLIQAIFMVAFNLAVTFFMPMTYVAFTYLFSIPVLFPLLLIGLVLDLASLIVILITPLSQTLCDKLSSSVIIKNDDLNEIYRAKGYDI